jgi:putative addiction module component (TIGR02574 family)
MTIALETLQKEVLRLSPADRSRLLDRLIESLDGEKALDELWDQEAARRDAQIEDGSSAPVDGKEVVARLRAEIR